MKILVTGFDPFGGEKINPAIESVKKLSDTIAGAQIVKLEIPTVCHRSLAVIDQAIQEHNPDVVLSIGQPVSFPCRAVASPVRISPISGYVVSVRSEPTAVPLY